MKITCFPEETINPDEKSDQFPQELKPASKTEIQRILCRTQMKLDKHCEKIERLSSEYEELTHFTVNTESYTKDAQIAKAESVKNVTVSSSSGVHTWYGYGASASANCRFDETIQQPRTEPIPMNYDAHEVEKLNSRYNTELDKAEAAADDGRPQEAAEHYRNAANTKEAIAHERGTTVPDKVQKLRSIADRAAKGDAIVRNNRNDGSSGSAHGTAETDLSNPGRTAATGGEGDSSEFREVIESFIVDTDVGWNDIGGLTDTKERLRRALALGAVGNKPAAVKASQSTLLFGPPGTGKTILAKAIATETDATFFNVKLGSLLSKWYGQSSQKIIALFEVARELSPSVIFLDEIDALTTSRGSGGGDDASRRVLGTLLSELSALRDDDSFTYVIGATNTPWDLDFAIRRRFDSRLLVPLPEPLACREIVKVHTTNGGVEFTGMAADHLPTDAPVDTGSVSTPTEAIGELAFQRGFTGSDIETLAGEIISNMVHRTNPDLAAQADRSLALLQDETLATSPIKPVETRAAFDVISSSLSAEDIARFHEWDEQYGTG